MTTAPEAVSPSHDAFSRALDSLTDVQRRAVDSPARALCIVAGAGSGKTRVLTLRVARRIRDGSADADHTAVCTFTRKAALELRGRLGLYGVPVSTPATAGGGPGPGVRAGTLHQMGLTLLRRHALDTGQPPPLVAEHRWRTIAGLVSDPATASAIDTEIGWAKARCLRPGSYTEAALGSDRSVPVDLAKVEDAFAAYEGVLARKHALDLDDVLVRAADLFIDDAGFADRMHWRYRHLSVDEFQDVNPAQFRLIRALLGSRHDLCAVGDPNQAIYGWNGADPSLLDKLPHTIEGMVVERLDENHRSTPQVVAAATAALGRTLTAPPRSVAESGPMPVVTAYDDDAAEAEAVVALLLERAEDGAPWSDQAVLARTHDQLATVGRALARAGIPHRMAPGPESPAADTAPGGNKNRGAGRATDAPLDGGREAVATPERVPWNWPPSTGPRASNGRTSTSWGWRRASYPSSTPSPPKPATRSDGCCTWPSPGPPGSSTARGPDPDAWPTVATWTASPRRGWPPWPGSRGQVPDASPGGTPTR